MTRSAAEPGDRNEKKEANSSLTGCMLGRKGNPPFSLLFREKEGTDQAPGLQPLRPRKAGKKISHDHVEGEGEGAVYPF